MLELSKQQMELIVSTALSAYDNQRKTEEKKEKDRRLRNTKLLLRNYNTFKSYVEKHEAETGELDIPIAELVLNGDDVVASIRQTTVRTISMVRHLDNALDTLKHICEREKIKDEPTSRHFDILQMRFIERRAIEEIAEEYNLNERTIYKQIDAGAERLSIMLFGVYGLKIV